MQTVNWYIINDLLNPLGGTADIDEKICQYKNIDKNNEEEVKEIIAAEIKPYYNESSEAYKISAKRSLSYFLTTNRINFGQLYDSCLIAFDHPDDSRLFFLWIWEILFPREHYHMHDIQNITEIEDINEVNSYL